KDCTMKLFFLDRRSGNASRAALAALATACAAACAPADEPLPPSPKAQETPAETPAAAPPRKLVSGAALPTGPVNLLVDPGFALVGRQAGYGSFLAFYARDFDALDLETQVDSR